MQNCRQPYSIIQKLGSIPPKTLRRDDAMVKYCCTVEKSIVHKLVVSGASRR
jgi:hypothetical protein